MYIYIIMCETTLKIIVNEGLRNEVDKRKTLPLEVLEFENNYFEALDGHKPLHPYIDLDGYFKDDDEGEFNDICEDISIELKKTFPNLPIMCRNHYNALKINKGKREIKHKFSYRITDHTKLCRNMEECRYYCENVFQKKLKEGLSEEFYNYFGGIDTGVYGKTTQLMSCMGSYKIPQQKDRVWELIQGELKHTIIQSVRHGNEEILEIDIPSTFQKSISKPKPKPNTFQKSISKGGMGDTPPKESRQGALPLYDLNDKIVKLLLNYMKNPSTINYKDFINIGLVLKNNDYPYKLWYDWGQLSEEWKNENTDLVMSCKWEEFHTRYYDIAVLYGVCKRCSPDEWNKWKDIYMNINYNITLDVLQKGSIFIGDHILPYIKDTCKYSQKRFIVYNDDKGLWVEQENILHMIGTIINKCIDGGKKALMTYLEKNDLSAEKQKEKREEDASMTKQYSKICALLPSIEKYYKSILKDDTFYSKLDCTINVMAFQNGIYDMETGIIRDIVASDMLTKKLNYPYVKPTENETEYVMEQMLKICNVDIQHRDYYLSVLSQALTGKSLKQIYYIIGQTGDNGKSTIFDVLARIFPCYVYKSDSEMVEKGRNDKHKFIVGLKGSRVCYIEELDRKKLDTKLLKNMTGGDEFKYKVMYGTNDIMKTTFTMFMTSNHTPNIETCGGTKNRNKLITFDSRFPVGQQEDDWDRKIFRQDRHLKDNLSGKYKNGLVQLILDYAKMYFQEGLKPLPDAVKEDTENLNEMNEDQEAGWLEQNIKIGDNVKLSKEMIFRWYEMTNNIKLKFTPREINDKMIVLFGVKYEKDLKFGTNKKGGWRGICFKDELFELDGFKNDEMLNHVWKVI
jgi:phage/plasmid-associated DNA primase